MQRPHSPPVTEQTLSRRIGKVTLVECSEGEEESRTGKHCGTEVMRDDDDDDETDDAQITAAVKRMKLTNLK